MKKIFYIFRYINLLLNKYNYYKSPDEILDAVHRAQLELFCHRYGKTQGYQAGRPVPTVAYQLTQKVSDDLKPFIKFQSYVATGAIAPVLPITAGTITLPPDFVHPTSIRCPTASLDVDVINDNEVSARRASLICPPSVQYPVAEILPNGYRIFTNTTTTPGGFSSVELKYLSLPPRPAYSLSIAIAGLVVSQGGTGYEASPQVLIVGGGGTGATATATVVSGVITNLTLTSPGSGYTTQPSVIINSAGGGTGAVAVATMGTELTYDDAASVDLLWNEVCVNDILYRALKDLGLEINASMVISYAQAQQQSPS